MIAGTLGPVASAFSICSLVESWRQAIPPGSSIFDAVFVSDPAWLIAVNAVQLAVAVISNLFLLLNMTKRVRFSIAQPITIVGWYLSAMCLIALTATAGGPLAIEDAGEDSVWSQAFYYAIYSAVLYFIVASLMTVTVWGAYTGHYGKSFELTMSQRTLMLQTLAFLVYLLLGALVFSTIEDWNYLDGVYWADSTLFTVGYGDISPQTTLGRALLLPYALVGITSLGLVIGSIRSLMLDRGKRRLEVRMLEKKRKQLLRSITRKGKGGILEPIPDGGVVDAPAQEGPRTLPQTELDRRRTEFALMRKIQNKASVRRRWSAMAISTSTWLVLWLVGAKIFETCERPYQGWSYFDGVYFAYTGLTTIGYGDYVPVSNGGKSFFVFWSLLALPTMTIFISNAGDTIILLIRDGTLRLGNITILPGDVSITKEIKQLLFKLSGGVLFDDDEEVEEALPGFLGAAQPKKNEEGDEDEEGEEGDEGDEDEDNTPPSTGDTGRTKNGAQRSSGKSDAKGRTDKRPRQTQRRESISPWDVPTELPKSRPEYHLLLIDEITRVTEHLQSTPPRKYTFKEVGWLPAICGQDYPGCFVVRQWLLLRCSFCENPLIVGWVVGLVSAPHRGG